MKRMKSTRKRAFPAEPALMSAPWTLAWKKINFDFKQNKTRLNIGFFAFHNKYIFKTTIPIITNLLQNY
jgi:hypothetical protein